MNRRRPGTHPQQRPVPPGVFDGNNTEWVNERLAHERQLRLYKKVAFWFALIVCLLLYGVFFLGLIMLHYSPVAQLAFVSHNHLLGLLIAILVIPSAILWGIVRAVFRVSDAAANETLKSVTNLHPFS